MDQFKKKFTSDVLYYIFLKSLTSRVSMIELEIDENGLK